jgi:hypothetical protein
MAPRKTTHAALASLAALAFLACGSPSTSSQASIGAPLTIAGIPSALGAAGNYALLAGTAVTCTDGTVAGNVAVYPGVPPPVTQTNCTITGTIDAMNVAAAQAFNDFVGAYEQFRSLPCDQVLTTLDGLTLPPGVYCFDAAATSTGGVLTLDGPSNGIWIFKVGTLGTGALTGTGFSVVTQDGTPPPCNDVYWWVAEAVTMTDSQLVGTILAGAAITLTRGTFDGDAFAKAAVTVTGTAVTGCALGSGGGAPVCKGSDFVTGGGWIRGASSAESNFGVAGGIRHGAFWGHLTYEDHARNGPKVKGEGVTAYVALDATTRHIEGTARVNGRPGFTYQVDVSDQGEPGRSDTFAIRLSNGYSASGVLGGGNIQLHDRAAKDGRSCNGDDGDDDDEGEADGQ